MSMKIAGMEEQTSVDPSLEPQPAAFPIANAVAVRAYELWSERGYPIGSPEQDWYRAEEELVSRGETTAVIRASAANGA